jgi:transposase
LAKRKTKIAIDLGLDDIKVKQVSTDEQGNYHIHVACTATKGICSSCAAPVHRSHGHCQESIIEHIPILEKRVFIHVRWPRFVCPDCNDKTTSFRPCWLNKTGNKTIAFEHYVLKNLINSTASDVAGKLQITEETVDGIVNRNINVDYDWSKSAPKAIGLDEIALRKGHNHYLTIVSDLTNPHAVRIISVLDGRKKEDIIPFLKRIPKNILISLESICIDMGASYFSSLKEIINDDERFNEIVTIDRFHVAKLVGEKADKARKKLISELKKDFENNEEKLEKIKGTMWPFRHHPKDLEEDQEAQLCVLFEMSDELKAIYDLRESLF